MQDIGALMTMVFPDGAFVEDSVLRCGCADCMREQHELDIKDLAQACIDLRTAILEQNRILEYLLVLTRKKQSARDSEHYLKGIDLIRNLLEANDDAGDSSQVD